MKAILDLDLIAPEEELEKANLHSYIILSKELDLPFTPFVGLNLHLPLLVDEMDVDFECFSLGASNNPYGFSSIFVIYSVAFFLESERFNLRAEENFETVESLLGRAEALVLGYHFERVI